MARDKDGARLYEWQDEQGVNFRLVVRDKVSGADTLPTSANEEIITFYSNRNLKDSTNFEFKNPSVAKSKEISEKATATNFTRGAAQPQNLDEIISNSSSQSQAPQKSLLEQARENTERLRAEQEAAQIAQKEAELAMLKEMQAKNAEILAQKEAAAGQAINEAQSLQIGTPIKAQKISDTKIIINDNTAPFKAEFIIAKKDDIKPNFERTGTQGRSERQDKVIESIQSDFKPHLIFEQTGGFEGLPIILKDGQVIAGNHRAQAIKGLTGENLARYKQAAKEKFGIDLKDGEVIVRLVKDGDEKELINLAFMSNVGRESNLGEKALANLAKYDSQIQTLPSRINADSVFELESQVAKALDTQGNGLNVFDTNLALFSRLAKNSSNTDILESLNTLKNLSQDEKEKVLRMFVSNAGEFHNLAKDTELKSLNLNDYLADALIVAAKNVDSTTRAANYAKLLDDIITMQASAKEMLKIDPFLFENFKSKALGYALARFARLENPAGKLFEFLKASKGEMENLYTGGLFDINKAISDIDIYDFLKHAINSGDDLMNNGVNLKHAITSKLDDLRKVENALIDSGEIQFAKSKAKPQGREAKETNINSLFADDELQMQATKPTKELNLSDEKDFNELGEFFKLNSKDKEFNEIFAKATKAAQRLGVKVKFDESAARSHFVLNDNTITIAAANKEHFQAQDLLHELIHATTRKALKDFNENPAKAAQSYTKRQIEAIKEINSLYLKSKGIAKRQGKDAYALQNVDEFVAELSSGEFRAFLKAQDIFERFIKALIRFFTGDSERLAKNVNSYKALKESYYKILDDYEPPLVEKSQSQLEFEMAQRQIGELKAQKAELLSQMRPPITQAVREEIKEKAKKLNKEIERTFLKAKLTQKIGKENLTSQRLEQARKNNERIIVDKLDSQEAQKLGFDEPEFVAQSIDGDAINHTLNRHGEGSELVRNGQPAVTLDDIAKYPQITKIADETLLDKTKEGLPAKVSFKQINGYYVVVEEVHKGQNELSFKTMYKGKGDYKNSEAYTTTLKNSKGVGASPLSSDLKSAEFYLADKEIIPNSKGQSQVKSKKEIIAEKIDIVDKFDEKQYALWNSELHRELTELQDKINKSDGKNLGIMGGDLNNENVMSFFKTMRYSVFANLFKEAKLSYESCKKIKELIKKGKKIDFNNRDLSTAINKFENPLAFAQNYTSTRLPQPYKNNLHKELEKILKKIESKSQKNIQEFKKALKSVDELNSLDLSYAPKQNNDEIQITLPKEKQTRFTMRQNAYKSLKEVEKTPLTNANDGRVAYLNKTGRQESLSDYAINESAKNGFDEAQHLATAQHLPELFENAKFKETTRDLKNNDNNVKIHRYTANFLLDNEPAQAQITLKETIAGQHSGNKIYTLKLESVSRLSPAEPQNPREALRTINDPKSSDFGEPSTKSSEIVSKIQEKFKFGEKKAKDLFEWHKDSSPLTKEADGTPKVFYHGSPNEFEVFDIEKTRGELGHYFTDDKSYAEQYMRDNGKIYAVFLKSKNIISLFDPKAAQKYKKFIFGDDLPELEKILKEKYKSLKASEYDLDNYKSAFYDLMRERNDKNVLRVPSIIGERLKTAGVDGVVSYKGAIVVFDSNQIKSIDNAGSWTDSAGKITKEKPSDESARHSYFNAQSPNILHSNEIWGGGLAGGTLNGLETDEDGNIIGFDPAKFVAGFIAGATGTKAVKSLFENPKFKASAQKFAIIQRIKAKRENTMKYNTFKKIDESQKYGSKMKLIGAENLNADIIAYALSKNKRFAVNKLDEQTAKALNFKYPNDVRRTIQPDEVIHTLKRHGENSNLVKFSGQKPVTLDDIAKYQHYADNAKDKGLSFDKQGNEILVSFKRLDNDFYVVVEQIRKSQNELGFKDLYFGTGEFDESKLGKKISLPASS